MPEIVNGMELYTGSMPDLRNGDIIAVKGRGVVSDCINLGTFALPNRGPLAPLAGYSHVGIYADPFVFESTSFNRPPCQILKRKVSGVQAHWPSTVGVGTGDVDVYRLRAPLYYSEITRLRARLHSIVGQPYDMLNAVRSGGGILSKIVSTFIREEDFQSLFCSELVAASLIHIGRLNVWNSQVWNPNFLLRYLRWKALYGKTNI